MTKIIEVSNLSFGYEQKLILDNISFSVDKGDFLGIIGPNGSGKSTILKLILKMLVPLSGEIKLLGSNLHKFNMWHKIGYVSQKANAFNTSFPATVGEVVGANLFSKVGLFKPLQKQHIHKVDHALELVGMQNFKNSLVGNLSGGQQQRVFIARVLVSDPEIMFLDEPTVGIDAKSEEAVYCLLAKLNKELGISVVMVTHDINAITTHASKIACMDDNGLFIHDPKDDFAEEYLSKLYGYAFKKNTHKHCCDNCCLGLGNKEIV